jgi:hypothetical protein
MINVDEMTMGEAEAYRLGQKGRTEFSRCGNCLFAKAPSLQKCDTVEAVRATSLLLRACTIMLPPWVGPAIKDRVVSVNGVCDLWKKET